ncbi:MAG TPA: hypothetical protein VFC19_19870 [Candidatus Limnocylindrales bacterium]|nr:hypothetical protein [Candidatus Limnocylindrales bacterium]
MKFDEGLLRRLIAVAATLSLAWPGGVRVPTEPTEPIPSCPPGSEVGIDEYIVWVDVPGGGSADIPIRSALPCPATRTISYKTYDITARAGVDYVGVNSGTVTLTGGSNYTTAQIRILYKTSTGPDLTFGVLLTSGARFTDPDATVTIKFR